MVSGRSIFYNICHRFVFLDPPRRSSAKRPEHPVLFPEEGRLAGAEVV
jgi:hypothetical protein